MTNPHLEPEWAMVTILVVDIRGFTTFADRSTARETVDYLNEFFALVIPVLTRHGGRANNLTGDGVLGVFGAPDHADRALAAAHAMLATVHRRMGDRCRIGIGLNSGLVVTGMLGAGDLVELSAVGDPLNVAARVQDATRDLSEPLLLTEATHCLLEGDHATLEPRGEIRLKGKPDPVAIYGFAADPVTLPGRLPPRKEPAWRL